MRPRSRSIGPVLVALALGACACVGCERGAGTGDAAPRAHGAAPAERAAARALLFAAEERLPFGEHAGATTCAAFSADGALVATGSLDGTVRIWDADGEPLHVLRRHRAQIEVVRFAPADSRVLSGSADGTARVWSGSGAELAVLPGHGGGVADARWSPGAEHVLTLGLDGGVRLWDATGTPTTTLATPGSGASSVSFSPAGDRVLVVARSRGSARLVELDARVIATLRGPGEALEAATFSPSGDRLLWASGEGALHVVDRDGSETVEADSRGAGSHGAEVLAIAITGRRIVTASLDGTARLWTSGGRPLARLEGHTAGVHSVGLSDATDRILTVSTDRTARLWNGDGDLVATLGDGGHEVFAARLAPDGACVLTLADRGAAAALWSPDGDRLDTLLPPEGERFVRAWFSPDGSRLLTLSSRRTARTWCVRGADLLTRAAGLGERAPSGEGIAAPRPHALPRVSAAVRTPGGEYTGSATCARCHRGEYDAWAASTHARSTDVADASNLPAAVVNGATVSHTPGETAFRRESDAFVARTVGADGAPHDYPVTHVVGRKRVRMLVTTLADGRLQVLPAMCELGDGTWFDYTHLLFGAPGDDWEAPPIVAPGDASFWEGSVRSFDARCAACHTSGYEPRAPAPDGVGARSAWRALGVDCEACHGPGRAHADAWDRMETGDPLTRLAGLPRDARTAVCTQCHMEAERIEPEYRIGADLYEYRDPTLLLDPERADPTGRPLELIYDGLPFATSHCAESGGLSCTDCHDPHGSHERAQLRRSPDEGGLCAGCHEAEVRDAQAHAHHDAQGTASRCVACHMPFLTIERGHGTVADHTIGIPRLDQAGERVARDACRWCHEPARDAPLVSPALDDAALRRAYERWWPDRPSPQPWMAALGAARAGGAGAADGLVAVARDESLPRVVRASAACLLERHGGTHAEPILGLTRDPDSLVRRSAVAALAGVESAAADARLLEALEDPSRAVRGAAARAALAGWRRVRENGELRTAATRILEEEADRVPEDSRRWFRLGAVRGIAGDRRGALEAYERMLSLDPFANAVRLHVERLRREIESEGPDR